MSPSKECAGLFGRLSFKRRLHSDSDISAGVEGFTFLLFQESMVCFLFWLVFFTHIKPGNLIWIGNTSFWSFGNQMMVVGSQSVRGKPSTFRELWSHRTGEICYIRDGQTKLVKSGTLEVATRNWRDMPDERQPRKIGENKDQPSRMLDAAAVSWDFLWISVD